MSCEGCRPGVIGVSGPPGSGKSTLVKRLARHFHDSDWIAYDEFELATGKATGEIANWLSKGGDYNALEAPGLDSALKSLKQGLPVRFADGLRTIPARKTIFFETPLGRHHHRTGRHIDYLIWIDVPLDIALVRKLHLFQHQRVNQGEGSGRYLQWQAQYLEHYLRTVRPLLVQQRERVGADADLILNGAASADRVCEHALNWLKRLP